MGGSSHVGVRYKGSMVDASDESRPASEPASVAPRERAPSLVEIAEAFVERASRVPAKRTSEPAPERMKRVAEQMVAERAAIAPPPSQDRPAPAAAPSPHRYTGLAPRARSPAPPARGPATPASQALPAPSRVRFEPRRSPDAGRDPERAVSPTARLRSWSSLAWGTGLTGLTVLATTIGHGLAPSPPHAANLAPTATAVATVARSLAPLPAPAATEAHPLTATPPPASELSPLVVREARQLESCDDVLGAPFAQKPVPQPRESAALWSRSRRALLRGKTNQALEQMCLAAACDIAGRATYGLSEYYFSHADFAQALLWARRVPEGSRRHTQARAMIGDIHHQTGDLAKARSAFLELYNIAARDEEKRREIAERLESAASRAYAKADLTTAERFYRRALTLDPENARAAAGLSRVLTRHEFLDAARHWLKLATRTDAASKPVVVAELEWSLASGERTRADAALQRLRELSPGDRRLALFERRLKQL